MGSVSEVLQDQEKLQRSNSGSLTGCRIFDGCWLPLHATFRGTVRLNIGKTYNFQVGLAADEQPSIYFFLPTSPSKLYWSNRRSMNPQNMQPFSDSFIISCLHQSEIIGLHTVRRGVQTLHVSGAAFEQWIIVHTVLDYSKSARHSRPMTAATRIIGDLMWPVKLKLHGWWKSYSLTIENLIHSLACSTFWYILFFTGCSTTFFWDDEVSRYKRVVLGVWYPMTVFTIFCQSLSTTRAPPRHFIRLDSKESF